MPARHREEILRLLDLIGDRVVPLHGLEEGATYRGGDIDCAVSGLDRSWPLRTSEWRLCQLLRYDAKATYWVVESKSRFVALDLLDDPMGIGRDSFRTSWLQELVTKDQTEAAAGAYLLAKRIRKKSFDSLHWSQIAQQAAHEQQVFERLVCNLFPPRVGRKLCEVVRSGGAPSVRLSSAARRAQRRRWLRRPLLWFLGPAYALQRWVGRLRRPTGFVLVIAGPDGTGKSSLADGLSKELGKVFRRILRIHWRPMVLMAPSTIHRRRATTQDNPHAKPLHGSVFSYLLLIYIWTDFLLGWVLRLFPAKVRSGLVIIERGWDDIVVDPARYRLRVSPSVVRFLGWLLPRADAQIVLEGPPELLILRKDELSVAELQRQMDEWRHLQDSRNYYQDVRENEATVRRAVTEIILQRMESKALRNCTGGWITTESSRPRWWFPARFFRKALKIYQPMTPVRLAAWFAARIAGKLLLQGVINLKQAPPREVRERLASIVPRGGTYVVSRTKSDSKFVAMILDSGGIATSVAKVSIGVTNGDALRLEGEHLAGFHGLLPGGLLMPTILDQDDRRITMSAEKWDVRFCPWRLPADLARLVGEMNSGSLGTVGIQHGDFAPWNVHRRGRDWILLDWEHAVQGGDPYFDVFHYLVQSAALLGHPRIPQLLDGIRGRGWMGIALHAYEGGARLQDGDRLTWFTSYLERSRQMLDGDTPEGRKGIRARDALRKIVLSNL